MTTAEKWRTCDMKSVAFLLYAGFPVAAVGKDQGRVFFDFADTEERGAAVLSFWNKKTTVEPVAFTDSLSRARDMVTQALKS